MHSHIRITTFMSVNNLMTMISRMILMMILPLVMIMIMAVIITVKDNDTKDDDIQS